MEKNINILVHELPDYITGNIKDEQLNLKIRNEIDSNPDFRAEYESMKGTFSFLGETALSEPSPFYFNNMLPNISNKIDGLESGKESIFSGWFANVLKFAIPALVLVIGYFLYTQFTSSDSTEEQLTKDKNDRNDKNEMIHDQPDQSNDNLLSNKDTLKENEEEIVNESTPDVRTVTSTQKIKSDPNTFKTADDGGTDAISFTAENDDELNELISESATYPVINEEAEIESVQDDLTSQQQDELLNYLENAQL
jgi:hypothetical protein